MEPPVGFRFVPADPPAVFLPALKGSFVVGGGRPCVGPKLVPTSLPVGSKHIGWDLKPWPPPSLLLEFWCFESDFCPGSALPLPLSHKDPPQSTAL